jgi:inner membrane protein
VGHHDCLLSPGPAESSHMDNLTHTLIGVVAGESIARTTPVAAGGLSSDVRRSFLVTIGAIGGNLPDIDLVLTSSAFAPDKIGYLLHHRGHTHTVLGCVALAFLLYAAAEGWARYRRLSLTGKDRALLLGMSMFGVLLHLAMDALNSYGVHPYWPFHNEWLYGDSVFIIEPLYWVAATPMLFVVRTWLARIVIGIAVIGALAIGVFVNREMPLWYVGIVIFALALGMLGRRSTARRAALGSGLAIVCITALFISSSWAVARRAESIAAVSFPGVRNIDFVLTPTPTNPLCWDLLLVQTGDSRYLVKHGVVSNAPGLVSAEECPRVRFTPTATAPMTPVSAPATKAIQWLGEFSMPQEQLRSLVAGHCEARELMQFARAPFAAERQQAWVLGDLRFDREAALGFTEIELSATPGPRCRYHVPWIPPRAGLLGAP